MTKTRKKNGANALPQLTPGMQSGSVFIKSNITIGQSSPVERRNIIIRDIVKFEKFI
jgi:hypothetical protein